MTTSPSSESTDKKPDQGPSRRRMTIGRRLYYWFGLPLFRCILFLLWKSYRVRPLPGQERLFHEPPEAGFAPCYWHQDHVLCSYLIRCWLKRGYKAGFLVSDSVDGEVPAQLARSWGASVVRGSANRTGAASMRDIRALFKQGVGLVSTADGPLGPRYEFKPGVVLMARIGQVQMLPMAAAADRAWYLRRWDNFMIPKPFSRVVVAIGEPLMPAPSTQPDDIEHGRLEMQLRLNSLKEKVQESLIIE